MSRAVSVARVLVGLAMSGLDGQLRVHRFPWYVGSVVHIKSMLKFYLVGQAFHSFFLNLYLGYFTSSCGSLNVET